MPKKISSETKEKIVILSESGKTYQQIADILGIGRKVIRLHLKSLGKNYNAVNTFTVDKECKFCKKVFTCKRFEKKVFCNRSCSTAFANTTSPKRKLLSNCVKCDKPRKDYRSTLCVEHHKEYIASRFEYTQELTLEDYWSKKSLSNLHASSKNAHIRSLARSRFKDLISKPCANCGYSKHVELCHIKPLKSFSKDAKIKEINSYENLIQLCPNCHWEFDKGYINLKDIK